MIDLNHGSNFIYGAPSAVSDTGIKINALIDAALTKANADRPDRDYLGASRIGEPCIRALFYEFTHTPKDDGENFDGRMLRIFDVGHEFEALTLKWLRAAGFILRTRHHDGSQFGFTAAGGKFRGHIDGAIVNGPDIGIRWPALWEHKAINQRNWTDLAKHGLRLSKPIYWAQCQIYMAYLDLPRTLFTAMNKDTQELYHEAVAFDAAEAQALSDKAVRIIQAVEANDLPPRIAGTPDHYLCQWCEYARRCWEAKP